MKSVQIQLKTGRFNQQDVAKVTALNPHLILAFGSLDLIRSAELKEFAKQFPNAQFVGCSTAGEISSKGFFDDTLVINAIHFDQKGSHVKTAFYTSDDAKIGQMESGKKLGAKLNSPDLVGVLLLAPGVGANPPEIVYGVKNAIPHDISVFGGLAGDGGKFQETSVFFNGEVLTTGCLAVGFYGESLSLQHSARGGWKTFGAVREVTKSHENVLFEIGGRPALDVYKESMGDHAKNLPKTGLSFPLSLVSSEGDEVGLMRAVLDVNEADKSLILAGDIMLRGHEQDRTYVRLARGKNMDLIDGAREAADLIKPDAGSDHFGILISCVARKIVMGQAIDDEIEAVLEGLKGCNVGGFYAYGEIGPFHSKNDCQLHNQTMTITLLSEKKSA